MSEKNNIVEVNPAPAGLEEAARLAGELACKRLRMSSIREQLAKAEDSLRKLKAYQAVDALEISLDEEIASAQQIERDLRSTALEVGIELKMKNPAPGITIAKKTTFTIEDEAEALKACHKSYPQLIEEKIKKAELKKIVVALGEAIKGTNLVEDEYGQVKIAKNLDEHYLTDASSESDVPF